MILDHPESNDLYNFISSEDALFHFTKRSITLENIIHEDNFKFSSFCKTNDPHEYKDRFIAPAYWLDLTCKNAVKVNNKAFEVSNYLNKLVKDNAVFGSFCQNKYENNKLRCHGFFKTKNVVAIR
jgi:hypothetical protein